MIWVLLYSAEQDAYHIETLGEYFDRPSNGYRLKAQGTRDYCEKCLAFLLAGRRAVGAMVEVGGKVL